MAEPKWNLPVIYSADTPVWRPIADRGLRAAIVFGIEWSSLSLIEEAPKYVKISTLVIAVLVLAVLESRYFLMLKWKWYFSIFITSLLLLYAAVIGYSIFQFQSPAPSEHVENEALRSQIVTLTKDRDAETRRADAEKQRADIAIRERDAAIASRQIAPPASPAPAEQAGQSAKYVLSEDDIRALADEIFQVKNQLPGSIEVRRVMYDGPSQNLSTQIGRAFDRASIAPSYNWDRPTTPDATGIRIRVADTQQIPDGAKRVAAALKKVGLDPHFETMPNLSQDHFIVFVGPTQ